MANNNYSILIIGDGGVGKSSYVRKVNTGNFKSKYDTTIGLEPHKFTLKTSDGEKEITILDTAGQEKFGSLRKSVYEIADAAFIMFDLTSRTTYTNIPNWYRDLTNEKGEDFPIVIIGNKLDSERKVREKMITFPKRKNLPYFEMSVKDETNLDKPFNTILQKLYKNDSIVCVYE